MTGLQGVGSPPCPEDTAECGRMWLAGSLSNAATLNAIRAANVTAIAVSAADLDLDDLVSASVSPRTARRSCSRWRLVRHAPTLFEHAVKGLDILYPHARKIGRRRVEGVRLRHRLDRRLAPTVNVTRRACRHVHVAQIDHVDRAHVGRCAGACGAHVAEEVGEG